MNKRQTDSNIKFIVDHMLGKLARWLRILGYDTAFSPDFEDSDIARIALREGRVVLTRDHGLISRRSVSRYILIKNQDYARQLQQVFGELGLKPDSGKVFTYCPSCNRRVVELKKEKARGLVPAYVFRTNESFSKCPKCRRIFWPGTHLERTLKKLGEIFHED